MEAADFGLKNKKNKCQNISEKRRGTAILWYMSIFVISIFVLKNYSYNKTIIVLVSHSCWHFNISIFSPLAHIFRGKAKHKQNHMIRMYFFTISRWWPLWYTLCSIAKLLFNELMLNNLFKTRFSVLNSILVVKLISINTP